MKKSARKLPLPDNAPLAATILKPVMFKDAGVFWCVLGGDLHTAITGIGDSVEDALEDWEDTLQQRVNANDPEDEVVKEIVQVIARHKQNRDQVIAKEVQEFYDQFRPVRR